MSARVHRTLVDLRGDDAPGADAVLDALAVAVIVQTPLGEIVRWNRAAEDMLGMDAVALRDRTRAQDRWRLLRENGVEFTRHELPTAIAVQSGTTQTDVVIGVQRTATPVQWLLVTSEPLKDADGTVVGVASTFSDITERIDGSRRIEDHLGVERALRGVARDMLQLEGTALDESVTRTLADVGRRLRLSAVRAFVVTDEDRIQNPYGWSASASAPVPHLACAEVAALEEPMRGSISILHVAEMLEPAEDALERIGMGDAGTVLSLRLSNDGVDFGLLMCASDDRREWKRDDIAIVEQLAALLGAMLASRRAADARRRVEDFLRTILASSADVIIVLDKAGLATYVSPVLERLLGYRAEEVLGRAVLDLVHPDDLAGAVEALGRVLTLQHGDQPAAELRVRHADGSWVWMECAGYPLMQHDQIAAVVVNARDITDRKRQRAELDEMLVRFGEVWDRGPTGMALVSLDATFLDVNPAHCALLGYTRDELVGASIAKVIPDDDLEQLTAAAAEVVEGRVERISHEVRVRRADGELAWGRVGISLVRDPHGEPLYVVATLEDVTELRRLRGELEHQATHDALTRLPERPLVLDMLRRALVAARRRGTPAAALFIDLDRFKHVNDTLGHAAGDMVLEQFGRRLRDTMRGGDVAGRLGGDEFVVLCTELNDASDVGAVAERVLQASAEPFFVDGTEVLIGASVGVAVSEGETDAETMLWQADTAAYRAKALGRDRYEVFDDALRTQVAQRIDTERALRHALERDELVVQYQPIVRGKDFEPHGVEGLARWQRPGHGLVAPADFLTVAEDAGLIVALGLRVIEIGCEQLASWQGTTWPDAEVALNISARQLLHRGFVRELRSRVAASGVNPRGLILEITEHSLMHDVDIAVSVLHEVKDMGVRLAIDDFGTGYSSLSQLRRLPVDVLKIDRSFVSELDTDDDAIVAGVVQLARALGMTLVAEGVEHRHQVDALLAMGCELMQGFYFAPALTPCEVDRLWEAIARPA